jgi:hypothetical protein
MFGIEPEKPLGVNSQDAMHEFMGFSEDIMAWLSFAEARSAAFQQWGTRPLVAWPSASKYALLNGGTTLLRLEADTVAEGATAMSIFSVARKATHAGHMKCSFKVRVDEVCEGWARTMQPKPRMLTMGFTTIKPADMDALGGLPKDLKATPSSILLFGDGCAHISADLGQGEVWCTSVPTSTAIAYKMKAKDTLECTWGKGFMKLEANGELLFEVKDPLIVGLPGNTPVFGVLDCCYAACRVTLMA